MVRGFLKRWRALRAQRCAMGWMLRRTDDRLLRDIGLTRNDVRHLLQKWDD
jgi:uncharacterized protein YjiS (DUF1127 family)